MSIVAKAGGFILVPGILARIALPRVVKDEDTFNQAAMKGALAYAAIAAGSYYASKHLPPELTDFAIGATWGAGISSATLALSPLMVKKDRQASTLAMYKRFLDIERAAPPRPASLPVSPTTSGVGEQLIAALTGH